MSRSDERRPTPPGPSEEDLLELLLAGREEDLREVRRDPDAAARLDALERFLTRWREPLAQAPAPLSSASRRRLTQRVLARTTRQDAGWRGDLAVVLRFVGDRLAASPALRVAAAVLLLQVLALPVLAWIAWSEPVREKLLLLRPGEPPRVEEALPAVPETPLDELVLEPPLEELRPARIAPLPGPLEVQRTLSTAARSLRTSTWPRPVEPQAWQDVTALRLLAARALLDEPDGSPAVEASAVEASAVEDMGGVERALYAELLLDQLALTGHEPEALAEALAALGSDAREPHAVRHLEALAIERARASGRPDARAWSRLAGAGATVGSRNADPLDPAWRAALREALRSDARTREVLLDAALQSWLGDADVPR